MRVRADVYVVGYPEHEVGHDLLWFTAVGVGNRCETRGRVKGASGADEHVAPEMYRGLILRRRLLITLLRGRLGLRWPDEISSDHDILLYHAFSGEDDMAWAENASLSRYLVASLLVEASETDPSVRSA